MVAVEDAGRVAIGGVPTCCHIEAAQRDMAPAGTVQLAPPSAFAVAHVSGAETSPDPAPFSMMETTAILRPPSEWRFRARWYSDRAPEWLRAS